MKVRDVMAKQASFCAPETNLAAAAELMWKTGCGFLPVVGEGGNVIGVITDRDICIALGIHNRKPSELLVKNVMPPELFTCTPTDDVHSALKTIRIEGVRRLPVVDREGALAGVLSLDDIVLRAREHAFRKDVSYNDVEDAYKAICGHSNGRRRKTQHMAA